METPLQAGRDARRHAPVREETPAIAYAVA